LALRTPSGACRKEEEEEGRTVNREEDRQTDRQTNIETYTEAEGE